MRLSIFIMLCALFGGALFVYYMRTNSVRSDTKLQVVCTTSMLADAIRVVGGEHVAVVQLMGPGVDPHLYRAREGDVRRLAHADLVLYHGLHLEGRMTDVLAAMNQYVPTVAVCECIPKELLRESEFEGVYDPHVWHDITLWLLVVTAVRDALAQIDPEHAADYIMHAQHYHEELKALDAYVKTVIAAMPPEQRILVTAHDAFAYYGAAYGLEVVALQGISTESDISMRDVIDLTSYIVNHHIKTLFLESSISSRNIEAVQQAVHARGWHVQLGDELYSDALGDAASGADTYVRMIKHNTDVIVQGLKDL